MENNVNEIKVGSMVKIPWATLHGMKTAVGFVTRPLRGGWEVRLQSGGFAVVAAAQVEVVRS